MVVFYRDIDCAACFNSGVKISRDASALVFAFGLFFLLLSASVYAEGGHANPAKIEMTGTVGTAESFINNGDGTTTFDFYPLSGSITSTHKSEEHLALTLQTLSGSRSYKVVSVDDNSLTILVDLDANSITDVADSSAQVNSTVVNSMVQIAAK